MEDLEDQPCPQSWKVLNCPGPSNDNILVARQDATPVDPRQPTPTEPESSSFTDIGSETCDWSLSEADTYYMSRNSHSGGFNANFGDLSPQHSRNDLARSRDDTGHNGQENFRLSDRAPAHENNPAVDNREDAHFEEPTRPAVNHSFGPGVRLPPNRSGTAEKKPRLQSVHVGKGIANVVSGKVHIKSLIMNQSINFSRTTSRE
ncbi:hypothetical protein AURDEDRAFT_129239 [Auricularia subglabra TFB-10046 SS5]|nr:hypothetical protein AURDEDRAFT_129239 [Auricularia subglabra TFB-10046 SS5]